MSLTISTLRKRTGGKGRTLALLAAGFSAVLLVSAPVPARDSATAGYPSFAEIAGDLKDAVVTISTSSPQEPETGLTPRAPKKSQQEQAEPSQPFEEFFQDFFGGGEGGTSGQVTSVGSGFVIDETGLIVTNNHVVEGGGEIYINFADGSRLKVEKIVGRDVKTDLTLLKVTPKDGKVLKSVRFGDSAAVRVGDWVMAVGNPFGLGGTVTVGILSATGRDINAGPYDEFLQTDAAINRGNSGGPLFNARGEVIGVNTAIISPTGGSIGLGFAVPSNTAKRVVDHLQRYGETRRGWIGVRVQSLNDDIASSLNLAKPEGALVASVEKGGPAEQAGFAEGDVIVTYAGAPVRSSRMLPRLVAQSNVEDEIEVQVLRAGERKALKVRVGQLAETGVEVAGAAPSPSGDIPAAPEKPKRQSMKGVDVSPLTDRLRASFALDPQIEGVVVTVVSGAHGTELAPGDVIVEAAHQKVRTLEEFEARLDTLRSMRRDSALLTVSKRSGPVSFVTVELN
jgi:serine protease Do